MAIAGCPGIEAVVDVDQAVVVLLDFEEHLLCVSEGLPTSAAGHALSALSALRTAGLVLFDGAVGASIVANVDWLEDVADLLVVAKHDVHIRVQILADLHQLVGDEDVQRGEDRAAQGEHVRERNLQVSVPVASPQVATRQLDGGVQWHPTHCCDEVKALQNRYYQGEQQARAGDDTLSGEGLLLFNPPRARPHGERRLQNGEASTAEAVDRRLEEYERADDPEEAEEELRHVEYLGLVLDPFEDGLFALM